MADFSVTGESCRVEDDGRNHLGFTSLFSDRSGFISTVDTTTTTRGGTLLGLFFTYVHVICGLFEISHNLSWITGFTKDGGAREEKMGVLDGVKMVLKANGPESVRVKNIRRRGGARTNSCWIQNLCTKNNKEGGVEKMTNEMMDDIFTILFNKVRIEDSKGGKQRRRKREEEGYDGEDNKENEYNGLKKRSKIEEEEEGEKEWKMFNGGNRETENGKEVYDGELNRNRRSRGLKKKQSVLKRGRMWVKMTNSESGNKLFGTTTLEGGGHGCDSFVRWSSMLGENVKQKEYRKEGGLDLEEDVSSTCFYHSGLLKVVSGESFYLGVKHGVSTPHWSCLIISKLQLFWTRVVISPHFHWKDSICCYNSWCGGIVMKSGRESGFVTCCEFILVLKESLWRVHSLDDNVKLVKGAISWDWSIFVGWDFGCISLGIIHNSGRILLPMGVTYYSQEGMKRGCDSLVGWCPVLGEDEFPKDYGEVVDLYVEEAVHSSTHFDRSRLSKVVSRELLRPGVQQELNTAHYSQINTLKLNMVYIRVVISPHFQEEESMGCYMDWCWEFIVTIQELSCRVYNVESTRDGFVLACFLQFVSISRISIYGSGRILLLLGHGSVGWSWIPRKRIGGHKREAGLVIEENAFYVQKKFGRNHSAGMPLLMVGKHSFQEKRKWGHDSLVGSPIPWRMSKRQKMLGTKLEYGSGHGPYQAIVYATDLVIRPYKSLMWKVFSPKPLPSGSKPRFKKCKTLTIPNPRSVWALCPNQLCTKQYPDCYSGDGEVVQGDDNSETGSNNCWKFALTMKDGLLSGLNNMDSIHSAKGANPVKADCHHKETLWYSSHDSSLGSTSPGNGRVFKRLVKRRRDGFFHVLGYKIG